LENAVFTGGIHSMKKSIFYAAMCAILALCLAVPCMAASVAQGKCVVFDRDKQVLTIDEYDINISKTDPYGKPTGKQLTFKLTNDTLIGKVPEPGNIIRLAFEEKGADKEVVRLQNVTKQDLMKK
jgi:hypothetical protein